MYAATVLMKKLHVSDPHSVPAKIGSKRTGQLKGYCFRRSNCRTFLTNVIKIALTYVENLSENLLQVVIMSKIKSYHDQCECEINIGDFC